MGAGECAGEEIAMSPGGYPSVLTTIYAQLVRRGSSSVGRLFEESEVVNVAARHAPPRWSARISAMARRAMVEKAGLLSA